MERLIDVDAVCDRILHCIDCGSEFIFTIGEQLYFASKQLSTPKRCRRCRLERRRSLVPDGGGRDG